MKLLSAILFLTSAAAAQLRVWSEFQRIDPFGNVVAADRAEHPREILSPAVVRNAWASFHVAVTVPDRQPYFLYIQTNPEKVFDIALFKELYVRTSKGWIPDALQRATIPVLGSLPYLPQPIPGQNTSVYWLDIRAPATAIAERVRLEVVLKLGTGWAVYPMEVRILKAVVPSENWERARVPPAGERSDAAVQGPLRSYIQHTKERPSEQLLTVRQLIRRNALQDMALARALERKYGRERLIAEIERLRAAPGPEWYLRVRDLLYRTASALP